MSGGRREVERLRSRLDAAFERISNIDEDELELRADFAKYLCVLVSGYLEKAIAEILIGYTGQQSGPRIQRYESKRLERFQPTKGNIVALFETFDARWAEELNAFIADERAAAIGAIVRERHRIAHGGDSTISYVRVKNYRDEIETVVEHILDLVEPPGASAAGAVA